MMMKKTTFAVFLYFFSLPAFSEDIIIPWRNGETKNYFSNDKNGGFLWGDAKITYATNDGEKIIAFTLQPIDGEKDCRLNYNNAGTDIVFHVNQQAIKGGIRCAEYTDTKEKYYLFWPYSKDGSRYIVNIFKRSNGNVSIASPLFDFNLSASGFTREWNSYGGNAL